MKLSILENCEGFSSILKDSEAFLSVRRNRTLTNQGEKKEKNTKKNTFIPSCFICLLRRRRKKSSFKRLFHILVNLGLLFSSLHFFLPFLSTCLIPSLDYLLQSIMSTPLTRNTIHSHHLKKKKIPLFSSLHSSSSRASSSFNPFLFLFFRLLFQIVAFQLVQQDH